MISMPPPSSTPSAGGGFAHAVLAADQHRGAEPLLDEARGGADHLLFLAFGEHHPLGLAAQPLENALQHAGDGIAARAQCAR